MSMRDEIKSLAADLDKRGAALTADEVVRAAQSAESYPNLHAHLWGVSETVLAHEARLARAHRLIISIRVVQEEGVESRLFIHTPGTAGYRPVEHVVSTPDLALARLQQLTADIGRSRQKLREFKALLPVDVSEQIETALDAAERVATTEAERRASREVVAAA